MPARVTITLPEPMLERLDSIAEAEGLTRSDVVREAASSYLAGRDLEGARAARSAAVAEGVAWLEQTASLIPAEIPSSLDLLREVRAEAGGVGAPLDRQQLPTPEPPQ